MEKVKFIGIAAPKQAGKDLTFELFKKHLPSAKRLGLADALKSICASTFGIRRSSFDDQSLKEIKFNAAIELDLLSMQEIINQYDTLIDIPITTKTMEIINQLAGTEMWSRRKVLQIVGTDFLRAIYPDIHLNVAEIYCTNLAEMAGEAGPFVITDCRFQNEIDWVQSRGGRIIYIERPEAELAMFESSHISERGIADLRFKCDYVLQNRGTIEELNINLMTILEVMNND